MNRPRHFDIEQLRECITDVFIEHGFNSTSISMLTDACGVGKQSLYNAVGDKEAAYLQALDCARQRNTAVLETMDGAPSGRQAVQRFFERVIEVCGSDDPAQKRCIVTAGLLEGIEAEAVTLKLHELWHELESLLQRAVERGQQDGSIRRDVSSEALSALLSTLFPGIRVAATAATSRQSLETTVGWVLTLMNDGSPAPP